MTVMTTPNAYAGTWATFAETHDAPAWVREIRESAWAKFEELGFPTVRDEDWRFTDVSALAENAFALASGAPDAVRATQLSDLRLGESETATIVFVDGTYQPTLSRTSGLPGGVVAMPLADALREHENLVRPHLGSLSGDDREAFTHLADAFLRDGVFVHVPNGTAVTGAIHVLFVSTSGRDTMTFPRVLAVAGESSEVVIVEDHVGLGEGRLFANAVTEIVVGANAKVSHYFVEQSNEDSYAVSTLYVSQSRDSDFSSHSALLGGALVRNNVFPTLNGENCMSVLNGMYVPRGHQLHDNRMRVRHAEAHSESRQYYRGILDGRAKAMFSGRIIVDEGAQKTDAVQSNKNLLLSADALVETKPQLEIYADDVKCTHGATIGQIDDEAIFYCEARGIPVETARRLLVFAFVNEIFERMELDPLRERLQRIVAERLNERE
ncbi:MAG: Fe-S cluster assembly protein SufD [bacterium]